MLPHSHAPISTLRNTYEYPPQPMYAVFGPQESRALPLPAALPTPPQHLASYPYVLHCLPQVAGSVYESLNNPLMYSNIYYAMTGPTSFVPGAGSPPLHRWPEQPLAFAPAPLSFASAALPDASRCYEDQEFNPVIKRRRTTKLVGQDDKLLQENDGLAALLAAAETDDGESSLALSVDTSAAQSPSSSALGTEPTSINDSDAPSLSVTTPSQCSDLHDASIEAIKSDAPEPLPSAPSTDASSAVSTPRSSDDAPSKFRPLQRRKSKLENLKEELSVDEDGSSEAKGVFSCPVCQRDWETKRGLLDHLRCHRKYHGAMLFKCPYCPRVLEDGNDGLLEHLREHTADKQYKCSECQRGFDDLSTLNKHLRIHKGEKPFSCPHCPKTFRQSGTMHRHINIIHNGTGGRGKKGSKKD